MHITERQLLSCLKAYRLGQAQTDTTEEMTADEWSALYRLSAEHKLSPVVFETLRNAPDFCGGNQTLAAAWKRDTILQVAGQAARTQKLLSLAIAMEDGEIPYAVVKGALCRQLYAKADLRPSGDEDILISRESFSRCCVILEANGMVLHAGSEADDVTHWLDGTTGLHVELHTSLFSSRRKEEEQLNQWFSGRLPNTILVPVAGSALCSLEHTDHFLFLVCHALKHFISGGFGVRTLCDIVTYAERYQNEIDRERVYRQLKEVGGCVFLDQIFAIGRDYLAFDPDACGWTLSGPVDAEEMLADSLAAGIYGQTSMSRRHSAALVLEAAEGGQTSPRLIRALFPPREKLLGRYPVLKRVPALLPVMWLRRLGSYGLELVRSAGKSNSPRESIALGKKRTEMMVKYGVIPKDKRED